MSAIPPDIAGAAAQAGFASSSATRARDADRTAQARLAAQQEQSRTDKADSVEAEDLDTAVFSDAEGAGSQGRATTDEEATTEDTTFEDVDSAVTGQADDDPPGARHLDIQA